MSVLRRKLMMSQQANKAEISYPGLIAAWSAKGKSNEDSDRDVLYDLTGNGCDISLKNFAYDLMSGYGGYNIGFSFFKPDTSVVERLSRYKAIYKTRSTEGTYLFNNFEITGKPFRVKIDNPLGRYLEFKDVSLTTTFLKTTESGIFEIDPQGASGILLRGHSLPAGTEYNVTIELLPSYPDALVFDGVDDWGISKSLPILTDYTIIVKRVFLDNEKGYSGTIAAKGVNPERLGAFCFERNDNTFFSQTSFGEGSRLRIEKDVEISWQTTLSYLGKAIPRGNLLDEPTFTIGTSFYRYNFLKGAIYSAYLFNRSLPPEEIEAFIKQHIDPNYTLPQV